jgi:hypothetical protein
MIVYYSHLLYYGKRLFWRMARSAWLLTGQDFPVFPTGNALFLVPCRENNRKKWKSVKMSDDEHSGNEFYYPQGGKGWLSV